MLLSEFPGRPFTLLCSIDCNRTSSWGGGVCTSALFPPHIASLAHPKGQVFKGFFSPKVLLQICSSVLNVQGET